MFIRLINACKNMKNCKKLLNDVMFEEKFACSVILCFVPFTALRVKDKHLFGWKKSI